MKVAIYGAGAMGTVLGAYITKAGYDIDLITRNKEHVKGLKEHGAKIIGKIEFVQPVQAKLPQEMKDKYDIIFLMTKQQENIKVVEFLDKYLKKAGLICTMQNGLPEIAVSKVIGKDRTCGCAMSWGASFIGKGIVKLTSQANKETMTFGLGKYGNNNEKLFNYIIELLGTMGTVIYEENFIGARWAKLLVNCAFSGLSAVCDANFGEIAKNKKSRLIIQKVIKECIEVAKAAKIKIEPIQGKDVVKLLDYNNSIKRKISFILIPLAIKKHRLIKSSMLNDLVRGRLCEIDAINGVVSDYGKKYGVKTPMNDLIIEVVHQIENKELISSWDNLQLF